MPRYYSHYTLIYPDLLFKQHIIETDIEGRIITVFPFEQEIANTLFYSGLLLFLPEHITLDKKDVFAKIKETDSLIKDNNNLIFIRKDTKYKTLHFEDFILD